MGKKRNEVLIGLADQALQSSHLFKDKDKTEIPDSYNGQIAALSVSVAMIGIRPTLAIYYQDRPKKDNSDKKDFSKPYRLAVLEVVAKMMALDHFCNRENWTSRSMLEYALSESSDLKELKKEVIDCAIALKQVVRTYKLVKV